MSWYYNYTLAIKKDDGKLYPFGPFDSNGKLKDIVSSSRSFASDLHERFYKASSTSMFSKELIVNLFGEEHYKEYYENKDTDSPYRYDVPPEILPFEDLPVGSFVKEGYYLIEDVEAYENHAEYFEGFFDKLTPAVYAKKLENELKFGKPKPEKDAEGYDITVHSVSEYTYYAYPDYHCEEYDSFLIREVADMMYNGFISDVERKNLYVVLTQG